MLLLSVSRGHPQGFKVAAGTANLMTNSTPLTNETDDRAVTGRASGSAAEEFFRARGFARPLGWGKNPAVLVVDFSRGFTDPASPLGADFSGEIAATRRVLNAARVAGLPVLYSTIAYDAEDARDGGLWTVKIPALGALQAGGAAAEIDPRLGRRDDEPVITKKFASCFFATDLADRLRRAGVDTLIITGCTTSGCVRATAVDAMQHGFRPIVVREAVGDRLAAAHEQSLIDLQAKYADVESVDDVLAHLAPASEDDGEDGNGQRD
jgi:maleamate amidohydrolase